jgi:DNA-nicking Smr family endonuclease
MKRPRELRSDERDLWNQVTKRTDPLNPKKPAVIVQAKPKKLAPIERKPEPIPMFRIGEKTATHRQNDLAPQLRDHLSSAPVQMKPEMRIDLHGMSLAEAHPELIAFIISAHLEQKRLVLVITGKGKQKNDTGPIPVRHGVLRHQVPQWLAMPPLANRILEVREAHLKHGGAGAYYVYLRRTRGLST